MKINWKGLTLGEGDYIINRVTGLGTPPKRDSKGDKTGGDGGNLWEQKWGARIIGVELTIQSDTSTEFFTALRNLGDACEVVDTDDTMTITTWDSEIKTIGARTINGLPYQADGGMTTRAELRIEFYCASPFFMGDTNTVTLNVGTGGGAVAPSIVPTAIGGATGNRSATTNAGRAVSCDIQFNGKLTNPSITNTANSGYFKVNTTINAGTFVRAYIDSTGEYVLLNNTTNYRSYVEGDFFNIETGSNTLILNTASADDTGNAVITYNETYLTI